MRGPSGSRSGSAPTGCFIGREPYRVDPSQAGVVILERYLDRVVKAAAAVDPDLATLIDNSASDSGFSRVPGAYTFVDADQANLV